MFSFTNPNPYSATTYTNSAGEFTFADVPPGGYIARATAADYTARGATFFTGVTVTSGEESHISLTLAALVQPIPSPVPGSDTDLTVKKVMNAQAVHAGTTRCPWPPTSAPTCAFLWSLGGAPRPVPVLSGPSLRRATCGLPGLYATASPRPMSGTVTGTT